MDARNVGRMLMVVMILGTLYGGTEAVAHDYVVATFSRLLTVSGTVSPATLVAIDGSSVLAALVATLCPLGTTEGPCVAAVLNAQSPQLPGRKPCLVADPREAMVEQNAFGVSRQILSYRIGTQPDTPQSDDDYFCLRPR